MCTIKYVFPSKFILFVVSPGSILINNGKKPLIRRAARYVQNNYHNTSSVTSMIATLGWPTLAERRLKTRLIMLFKITHALIAIPNIILIPTDSRTRKSHNQTFRHITTQKDTYKWSFFPHTIVQWNILPQTIISSPSIDSFREQLTPAVLLNI